MSHSWRPHELIVVRLVRTIRWITVSVLFIHLIAWYYYLSPFIFVYCLLAIDAPTQFFGGPNDEHI